jgi:hypothetical protein
LHEVGPAEVGIDEVRDNIWMVRPPLVPVLKPLKELDVLWIGHGAFGSIQRIFAFPVV